MGSWADIPPRGRALDVQLVAIRALAEVHGHGRGAVRRGAERANLLEIGIAAAGLDALDVGLGRPPHRRERGVAKFLFTAFRLPGGIGIGVGGIFGRRRLVGRLGAAVVVYRGLFAAEAAEELLLDGGLAALAKPVFVGLAADVQTQRQIGHGPAVAAVHRHDHGPIPPGTR